ncbi:ABC transporter permease [Lichenicola sp.]|uniref:ABC transporter permease n=1 Tax=Lichenicola sp. TaxID=2804529 RepID=UPI003B0047A8
MSTTMQTVPDQSRSLRVPRINIRDFGTLIGLVLMMAIFAAIAPGFLSERNLVNILQQSSINAFVALGMTLVIISGGIDLSVGPTAALAAVLAASLMTVGVPVPLAILAGLVLGALCGAVNGMLISFGGLQPFIVTLGTLSTYRALALIVTGGNPILGIPHTLRAIANGRLLGIPTSVLLVGLVAILAGIMLRRTPFGEYLLAVGGNEEASHIAGVPIALTKIGAYALSGTMAALAAMILIGRLGAAEPILGSSWELDAIAAAAIGGASLMGGKGSIIGTLLGAIILGAMRNGLTLLNVQAFYQLLATGLIILFAMLLDRFTRGRS